MYKYKCFDHFGLCKLKVELRDMAFDFKMVAKHLMKIYDIARIDEVDRYAFTETLKQCTEQMPKRLQHSNRLYITVEYIYPVLVLVDIDADVLNHLIGVCTMAKDSFEDCLYCPILWVFQGRKLTKCHPITLSLLAQLTTAFSCENLISRAELRDRWIHLPKHGADRQRKLRERFPELVQPFGQ